MNRVHNRARSFRNLSITSSLFMHPMQTDKKKISTLYSFMLELLTFNSEKPFSWDTFRWVCHEHSSIFNGDAPFGRISKMKSRWRWMQVQTIYCVKYNQNKRTINMNRGYKARRTQTKSYNDAHTTTTAKNLPVSGWETKIK